MPPLNNTPVIYCMIPGAGDEGRHFFPTEASRVDRDVVDLIEHQPPAFYLRSQWPAEILIPEAADEVEGHNTYGQVPNCFELPDEEYSLHLAYIHALYRGVFKGAWATGTGLQAFLKIVVRGQEHCTAVIDNEFRVLGYPIPQVWISERDVNGIYKGHEFCPGTTPWNAEHAQAKFNRDLKGRRFWVAVFNFTDPRDIHSGRHWAVTIFDRRASCLLYIDSVEVSRGERARSAAIMWRQFLHNLYLPYKFLLIVPPMTPQDNEWASGYLAVFEALLILRGWTGIPPCLFSDSADFVGISRIEVDAGRASPGTDEYVNVLTSRCELHWADWSNLGFTGKAAIKAMKNVMIKVMANELGVERGMKGEDGGYHNINFEDFKTMDLTSLRFEPLGCPMPAQSPYRVPIPNSHRRVFPAHITAETWEWRRPKKKESSFVCEPTARVRQIVEGNRLGPGVYEYRLSDYISPENLLSATPKPLPSQKPAAMGKGLSSSPAPVQTPRRAPDQRPTPPPPISPPAFSTKPTSLAGSLGKRNLSPLSAQQGMPPPNRPLVVPPAPPSAAGSVRTQRTDYSTISAAKIMELQAKIDAANERLRAAGLEEVRNEGIKLAPQPDFAREFREAAQDKVKWTEDWIERANPMKQAVSPDPDHCSEHLSQLGLEPTEDDGYSTLRVDTERVQGAEFVPMSREIWAGIMAKNEARERKNKRLSLTTAWPRELYPARREPTGFYTNSHGSVIDLVPDGLMDLRAWTEVYERFRSQGVDRTRQAEEREARHERRAQRQDGGQPRGGNPTS